MPPLVPGRVLTLGAAFAVALAVAGYAQATALTRSEASLLKVMNEARSAHGLRPLRVDWRLESAARGHSSSMIRTQTFLHGDFVTRIRRTGVSAPRIGENLGWGVGISCRARAIVSAWLASPEHRANLLHGGYRTVGVGALKGSFEGYAGALVITTDFAGS